MTLLYEAAAQPGEAHTAFVHLLDADGRQVAGRDQPPAEGRFPTDRWQTGDRVLSEFAFDLPLSLAPGVYELRTGLYPTASGGASRLRVQSSDQPIRDDTVFLGTVEIE